MIPVEKRNLSLRGAITYAPRLKFFIVFQICIYSAIFENLRLHYI